MAKIIKSNVWKKREQVTFIDGTLDIVPAEQISFQYF